MESGRNSPDSLIQQESKKIRYCVDPIPNLPPEIIKEILLRLPVKSLLKFRCVSRSWRSLISSKHFVNSHLEFSKNDPNFVNHNIIINIPYARFNLKNCSLASLFNEPATAAESLDYPVPRKRSNRSVSVVGSCNGIICIAINEKDLFLWNPSLRKSKKLPDVDVPSVRGFYFLYGFGFDDTNEDYKVVGIFSAFGNAGGYENMVKIYSLRSNTWRRMQDFEGGVPLDDSCLFAQGNLHCSVSPGEGFSSGWDIISLDITKETYGKVEQPNYGKDGFISVLGVLGGCICVLCSYPMTHADIWVMKEYGVKESWIKISTIPYADDPGKSMYSVPLSILPNGEVLLTLGCSFVVYNPKDNSFRYPRVINVTNFLEANTYIESLLSPVAPALDGLRMT